MNQMNLAENIIRLRHEKNITQEQLADFLGVTKASVSKWENRQSMPDILLLPQLAVFFDVTIDRLMGYEPQLGKEQIQKLYQELAAEFAASSFEEAMEKSRRQVQKYYSCHPFLLQICILWLNHYMLPRKIEQQQAVLKEMEQLCDHIIQNCTVVRICNDAITLKSMAQLQLGRAPEVVETLECVTDPKRISTQNDMILIQAYQMQGDIKKARSYTQIVMYTHLMSLIGSAVQYLSIEMDNLEGCQKTIRRMETLIETYKLETLHPNVAAQFHYQASLVYLFHGRKEEALEKLQRYGENVRFLLQEDELRLHGDDYFDCLAEWIEQLDLGAAPPRNRKMVYESFEKSLEHPMFAAFKDCPEFQQLRKILSEEGRKKDGQ